MAGIRESDLFELKTKVDEGTNAERDVLQEMASAIKAQLDGRQAELNKLREQNKK
jgi:hypothetical protein